jgi:hypothetical protein
VIGQAREVLQPWIQGLTPPAPTDAEFDALMAHDSRAWVAFEVGLERERRALAAQADAGAVAPAITVVAQGEVDVEEIDLVPDAPVVHVEVESAGRASIVAVEAEVTEPAAAPVVEAVVEAAAPPPAADSFVSETSAPSVSDAAAADGGDSVATASSDTIADDLPWGDRPAVLPGEPVAPKAELTPVEARAVAEDPVVPPEAPAEVAPVAPAPEAPAAERPAKERPKGYCPACAQLLTVRADGGMMQHFTPDERKGPDGKRVSCQGVGLAPRSEQPPIERLTLPAAMGIGSISEVAPAASVELAAGEKGDQAEPLPRFTIGGSAETGWCVMDVTTGRGLSDMGPDGGGILRIYAAESDAWKAVVYVREHGELPDGDRAVEATIAATQEANPVAAWPDEPKAEPSKFHTPPGPFPTFDMAAELRRQEQADLEAHEEAVAAEVRRLRALADAKEMVRDLAPALSPQPVYDPIEALTRMVEDAKRRGVRVRITIEPIE